VAAQGNNFRDRCRTGTRLARLWIRYGWQRLRCGKDERSPVGIDEFVLRRIHKNNFDFKLSPPVKRPAFEPNPHDDDGLSVHRELFITAENLAWRGRKPGEYFIARLGVRELASENYRLTVIPSSDADQPPGHAVIPELKTGLKTKPLQKSLADLASDRIVYSPSSI
jgi:hypothetical protein